MDALKLQFQRIQQQLNGLSATQKMLTASLLAIMVITILFWTRYAATAEMEPVLDQSLSAEVVGQIRNALVAKGIPAQVSGDRVLVPADRRLEAVAELAYANALPSNATAAWDEMAKQMSPWDSKSKTDAIQNQMRERALSYVITHFFPNVSLANVMINPVADRRIGKSLEPTASVQVTTRADDGAHKRLAEAVASTVASAISGMSRGNVTVVINGATQRINTSSSALSSGDILEQTNAAERHYHDKIVEALAYIPNPFVAVTVDVDTIASEEEKQTFDPKNTFSKEKSIDSTEEESTKSGEAIAEAGVQSNVGSSVDAAPAASGGSSSRTTRDKTEMELFASRSVERRSKPAGKTKVLAVSVRVPRSYFAALYKSANPTSQQEPDTGALEPLITAELPKIRQHVNAAAGLTELESVSVDTYFDNAGPIALAAASDVAAPSGMGVLFSSHVKEIVLGALAVLSLFMVSTIVKKGAPLPAVAAASPAAPRETPKLNMAEDLAGVVGGEMTQTLDALEVDDADIRDQQVVSQVTSMVKENPDAAASLVKRWMAHT